MSPSRCMRHFMRIFIIYPKPSIQMVTNHQLAIKSSWMNTKCIAFWNRISAIALCCGMYLKNHQCWWHAFALTLTHTNPKKCQHIKWVTVSCWKRRLHHLFMCSKIDIQNRVNVTAFCTTCFEWISYCINQWMAIFQFISKSVNWLPTIWSHIKSYMYMHMQTGLHSR